MAPWRKAQGIDTGDLARIDAQGYVRITGRSKDVIIRGGENIPVVEIESLCEVYLKALAVAEPVILSADEMAAVLQRFRVRKVCFTGVSARKRENWSKNAR